MYECAVLRPIEKYTMHPNRTGVIILIGISAITLPKKYAVTEYMLLFTSLRKTGLSSGKIRIIFWMALNAMVIVMKKRAPFLFCTPCGVPSQFWKRMIVNIAVITVTITLTYDVCGSLSVFKKFLWMSRPSW